MITPDNRAEKRGLAMSTAFLHILLFALLASATDDVDPRLPQYKPASKSVGRLSSVGSDSLNNLMTLWGEEFNRLHPGVIPEIEGKGGSIAIAALVSGRVQLATMVRLPNEKEVAAVRAKFGGAPIVVAVARDALGVFVHKDNPIKQLNLRQLDAVFGKTRRAGAETDIVKWGDLGLEGEWADKPIRLFGRNAASGAYAFFKETCLLRGDFKDTAIDERTSSDLVRAVGNDRYALGYAVITYKTDQVRAVPMVGADGKTYDATRENIESFRYPLVRSLHIALPPKPDDLTREFLRYVLSRQGQSAVVKDGYLPLSAAAAQAERTKIGLE